MKHICLISPGHLSTNPRLVKEALALKQAGYCVQVVHGRFKPWGTAHDLPLSEKIGDTTSVAFGPTEATRLTYLRQTAVRHSALTLAHAGLTRQRIIEAAHAPIVRDLQAAVMVRPADLYIAHYVAALPAAAQAAKRHGARYAFDAEDYHLGDMPDEPEYDLENDIIRRIEGRYLPGAAFVTAASPMIAEAYTEAYGIPMPTTILNVFPKEGAPSAPTLSGSVTPGPSLYWFSQTIGPGRGLETAMQAIAQASSQPHLYLRGTPANGYEAQLWSLAHRIGIVDRLHFLEPASPDDLERLGATFDIGLVAEIDATRNRQIALTNKLFSYLLGGIHCVATAIPAHHRLADEVGSAMSLFPVGDANALAAAIDALLLDPGRLAAARAHAWRLGQERFNWNKEQTKLLQCVDNTLASRGALT